MLRFTVADGSEVHFQEAAREVLALLAGRPGYLRGQLGQAYDEPRLWCLLTEWESVGAYRRALGSYDVKVKLTPLLGQARDEPTAFEPLATAAPGGTVTVTASDRGPIRSRT
jgi:hypothetical protein